MGKGYVKDGMFKMNVITIKNAMNKEKFSAYILESSNLWHSRLGHINFESLRKLIYLDPYTNLISIADTNVKYV